MECWLGSFVVFQGILTSVAKEPYIFLIFPGGSGPPVPPLDLHMGHSIILVNIVTRSDGFYTFLSIQWIHIWASMRENLSLGGADQPAQSDQRLLLFAYWKVSCLDLLRAKIHLST